MDPSYHAESTKTICATKPYAIFNQFSEAISGFFLKTLLEKWQEFTNTITDNFRIISFNEYKVIGSDEN
tara:strand:- start:267 stop:473 length:207 start_codon:yes stop_codon:yes gene_type:complete